MITITVKRDKSCSMASVYDNIGNGMEGNYWDFHNGCHGLYHFEKFNSVRDFISVLKRFHESKGENVKVIESEYRYF